MGKLSWWVPRWSYARRLVRGHRDVLRSLSFARILVWSLVGSAVICVGLKAAYPDLDLHGLWRMPFAVLGLPIVLGFNLVLLPYLIPPRATVSSEEIRHSHGESVWVAKREDCTSFKLVVFSSSFRRLIFRHQGNKRSVGLAGTVDLNKLRSLLPHSVKMVDARQRFASGHKVRTAARRDSAK